MLSYKCGCGSTKHIVGNNCDNHFVEGRECDFCGHDHNLAIASDGKYYCQHKRGTYSCFERAEIDYEFGECAFRINHETDESYFHAMIAIKKAKKLSGNHLWLLDKSFGTRKYHYLGLKTPENIKKGVDKIVELASHFSTPKKTQIRNEKAFFANYGKVRTYLFTSDNQSTFVDPNLYSLEHWRSKILDWDRKEKLGLPIDETYR